MVALTMPADGLDPTEPYGKYSCRVSCGVDLYGIADLPTYHDASMLGKTFAEAPELYRLASPVTYVRSNSPPLLVIHGTADRAVKIDNARLAALRIPQATCRELDGSGHLLMLGPRGDEAKEAVVKFLLEHSGRD